MSFGCLTDFNRASNRRLDGIAKDQRHPIPGRNPDQHAVRVRGSELRSVSYDFIECLESFALFVEEQFRVSHHVHEQDVADLQLEIRFRISGHIAIRQSNYTAYTLVYGKRSLTQDARLPISVVQRCLEGCSSRQETSSLFDWIH
jgi:hypothetical protein